MVNFVTFLPTHRGNRSDHYSRRRLTWYVVHLKPFAGGFLSKEMVAQARRFRFMLDHGVLQRITIQHDEKTFQPVEFRA